MRQVGILGAACHYALDNNISRLEIDHKHAKILAEVIHKVAPSVVDPQYVETNIVGLDLIGTSFTSAEFAARAKENGVLVSALGPKYARLVTHLDVSKDDIEIAAKSLAEILRGAQ